MRLEDAMKILSFRQLFVTKDNGHCALFALMGALLLAAQADAKVLEGTSVSQPTSTETVNEQGYRYATEGYTWEFPRDHGSHPDYALEWWYYTGHMDRADGASFGFHLTFFRAGLQPEKVTQSDSNDTPDSSTDASTFRLNDVYWAHFAITDIANSAFYQTEKLHRNFPGLAEAATDTLDVKLKDWSLLLAEDNETHLLKASLYDPAAEKSWAIELEAAPTLGPIFHGKSGYSQKGPRPQQASMYYTMPRLKLSGHIAEDGEWQNTKGSAWMDHEFMTNLLDENQVGWDWFSQQFDDGSALMVYQIRLKDGGVEPLSKGTWISPEGETTNLRINDYSISQTAAWMSPHTDTTYPAGWEISIPKLDIQLSLSPSINDQEMRTHRGAKMSYWEGSTFAKGTRGGAAISGRGYTELVGYQRPFNEDTGE
jgi:predicted secreted hydrolase